MSGYTTFDEESGQIYHEVAQVVPRGMQNERDWMHQTSQKPVRIALGPGYFSRQDHIDRQLDLGAASLADMATSAVLRDVPSLNVEVLKTVPWSVGQLIWHGIVARNLESLHAWKTFVTAFAKDLKDGFPAMDFLHQIVDPHLPLDSYMSHVMSSSLDWLTRLVITSSRFTRTEYVNLCKCVNLASLEIFRSSPESVGVMVDDSIVRAWSRAATDGNQFRYLQHLVLGGHYKVTPISLTWLRELPALREFEACLCHYSLYYAQRSPQMAGWTLATETFTVDEELTWRSRRMPVHLPDSPEHLACKGSDTPTALDSLEDESDWPGTPSIRNGPVSTESRAACAKNMPIMDLEIKDQLRADLRERSTGRYIRFLRARERTKRKKNDSSEATVTGGKVGDPQPKKLQRPKRDIGDMLKEFGTG